MDSDYFIIVYAGYLFTGLNRRPMSYIPGIESGVMSAVSESDHPGEMYSVAMGCKDSRSTLSLRWCVCSDIAALELVILSRISL